MALASRSPTLRDGLLCLLLISSGCPRPTPPKQPNPKPPKAEPVKEVRFAPDRPEQTARGAAEIGNEEAGRDRPRQNASRKRGGVLSPHQR